MNIIEEMAMAAWKARRVWLAEQLGQDGHWLEPFGHPFNGAKANGVFREMAASLQVLRDKGMLNELGIAAAKQAEAEGADR